MTEPKFTKGPYRVGEKQGHGTAVYNAVHGVQVGWIGRASTYGGKGHYRIEPDEAYANACLYSAAPELYAELERIDPNNPVLAKARGETPR